MDEYLLTEDEVDNIRLTTEGCQDFECNECPVYSFDESEESKATKLLADKEMYSKELNVPDDMRETFRKQICKWCKDVSCVGYSQQEADCWCWRNTSLFEIVSPLLAAAELKGGQEERNDILEKLKMLSDTYSLYIPEIRIYELIQSLGGL